jgi:hypothetical protein
MAQATEARTAADLEFGRTLPAALVHKAAVEQVFLTDWMKGPEPDLLCTIAAELPLAHARFSDAASGYHDLVLLAEVVRQGGLVSAAKVLEVPEDRQFLLRELRVAIDPLERNRRVRECARLLIEQDASQSAIKMRRGGNLAGGKMHARLKIDGEPSGVCEVVGLWLPDEMYAGFRGGAGEGNGAGAATDEADELPQEPEERSGKSPQNTVIGTLQPDPGQSGLRGRLLVAMDDPTFFDHPLDHVPGLLMLEAMQQAAVGVACREHGVPPRGVAVTSFDVKFSRIAEFSPAAACHATLTDRESATVEVTQLGKTCCDGVVGLALL